MTTILELAKVCRICSSRAEYDLFARIPTYLHANSNEFLSWQKPINVLLEETTGLKISADDGLPSNICALCISYLKHAVTFREQVIKNSISLKAVQMLENRNKKNKVVNDTIRDKESLLITAQDLAYSEERQVDTNLLVNNSSQQELDKVCKQLLNKNFAEKNTTTHQNVEQQIRYLNLLFDKDTNAGLKAKHENGASAAAYEMSNGGDEFQEDEFPTTTSSEDNDEAIGGDSLSAKQKDSIFSYKEKNFEEDDIMDTDELRNVIQINIPESCKERKCRACSRRFMFEESYNEHMETCIEYRFLTFVEEVNRLLDIRRNKAVSPHEFIRRMIFCLRKTCEWLKSNCIDMLMPDLLHSNGISEAANLQKQMESEGNKSSSSGDQKTLTKVKTAGKLNELFHDNNAGNDDKIKKKCQSRPTTELKLNFVNENLKNLLMSDENFLLANTNKGSICENESNSAPSRNNLVTPINITNNILYEIERSNSRNSQQGIEARQSIESTTLMKPIAVMATNITTKPKTTTTSSLNASSDEINANAEERLTFLHKLQQAACKPQTSNNENNPKRLNKEQILKTAATPPNPKQKDSLPPNEAAPIKMQTPTPVLQAVARLTPPFSLANQTFSARCNPCNLIFETLGDLEVHNAIHHNNLQHHQQNISTGGPTITNDIDEERKRIIALFDEVI